MSISSVYTSLRNRTLAVVGAGPDSIDPWDGLNITTGAQILAAVPPEKLARAWQKFSVHHFRNLSMPENAEWPLSAVKEVAQTMPLTEENIKAFVKASIMTPNLSVGWRQGPTVQFVILYIIRRPDFTADHGRLIYNMLWKNFLAGLNQADDVSDILKELSFQKMLPADSPVIKHLKRARKTKVFPFEREFFYSLEEVPEEQLIRFLSPNQTYSSITSGQPFESYLALVRRFPNARTFSLWPEAYEHLGEKALLMLSFVPDHVLAEHFPPQYLKPALVDPLPEVRLIAAKVLGRLGKARSKRSISSI